MLSAPLLTEAELIRLMKERGIGSPSTYAVIVDNRKRALEEKMDAIEKGWGRLSG